MRYTIFDDLTHATAAEVQRLLPLVSPQRREQALRLRLPAAQYACLQTYRMLCELLADDRPDTTPIPPTLPTFLYNEYGKPYLPDGPHFSISHCRHALAVACSDSPIGIDIESVRPLKTDLVHHTMSPDEADRILSSPHPAEEFICLWTQKEAVLKLLGTGITSDLRQVLHDTTPYRLTTLYGPHTAQGTTPYIYSIAEFQE